MTAGKRAARSPINESSYTINIPARGSSFDFKLRDLAARGRCNPLTVKCIEPRAAPRRAKTFNDFPSNERFGPTPGYLFAFRDGAPFAGGLVVRNPDEKENIRMLLFASASCAKDPEGI